jgi:organic radical activating enzyme
MRVTEIFQSIQGEGPDVGKRAIFIRMHGCNLSCPWCDTKYSWDDANYYEMDSQIILDWINRTPDVKNVVITGGEPLLQLDELIPLIQTLRDSGRHVALETNGTIIPPDLSIFDLVVVSPKGIDTANNWCKILSENKNVKLKLVIHQKNIDMMIEWIKEKGLSGIYLMPIGSDPNTLAIGSIAIFDKMIEMHVDCIISPRVHILVGIK